MKFEKRQIIIITITAVMVAGFIFFQYMPMSKAIAESKLQRDITSRQEQANIENSTNVPAMEQKIDGLVQKVGNFDAKIPADRDFGGFMQSISAVMSNNKLKDQLVKPAAEMNFEDISIIPVSIECTGKFGNIFAFLKDFEANERIFNLENIMIENTADGESLKLSAKCNIFYRQ